MLRLFVGIALPPEQRLRLSAVAGGLAGAKWVDPGNYHVTLRFIGEVGEGMAADVDAALARIRAPDFELEIHGMDFFTKRDRPEALFAGVARAEPLLHLRDKVEAAVCRTGLPPNVERYRPHVTLARVSRTLPGATQQFAAAHNLFRLPPFRVGVFSLVISTLTKSGSVYEDAATYPLSAERARWKSNDAATS